MSDGVRKTLPQGRPGPSPSGLLVEHPALPLPLVVRGRITKECAGPVVTTDRLSRRDRLRCAVQLACAATVLVDFDLWPGRRAIRKAQVVETPSGLQARLDGFPMPLAAISRRLGGGERAALELRDAVTRAVVEGAGIATPRIKESPDSAGFFLAPLLRTLLGRLRLPLDSCTASNLWGLRWDPLTLPQVGEVGYWSVPRHGSAMRLASALWLEGRRMGRSVWLRELEEDAATAPRPSLAAQGTLILVGAPTEDDLAALERWVGDGNRSAAVLGRFPRGWNPPTPPGIDPSVLERHLSVVGAAPDVVREAVQRRIGRFQPLSTADRTALTDDARTLFTPAEPGTGKEAALPQTLDEVLGLIPEGVPEGFVTLHTGLVPDDLHRRAAQGALVIGESGLRPVQPRALRRHPLHMEAAGFFVEGDPRRLLHHALATGEPADLLAWARRCLEDLRGEDVRAVLVELETGELGEEIDCALAEACLLELDLVGARHAISAARPAVASLLGSWIDAVDRAADARTTAVDEEASMVWPRAAAEAAFQRYRKARTRGAGVDGAEELLNRAVARLHGAAGRWFEIEKASVVEPGLLADRGWRRGVAGDHPVLCRRLCHKRALQLHREGRSGAAVRLLSRLADTETSPGRLGLFHFDLGFVEAERGRPAEGERHWLAAHRLMQATGFSHLTRNVLFNLGVADLDRLELERAERRFLATRKGEDDPFFEAESARLLLARGDEDGLRSKLAIVGDRRDLGDSRFTEAYAFLNGAASLLAGQRQGAVEVLAHGGDEGKPWLDLAAALMDGRAEGTAADGWGVSRAAAMVRQVGAGDTEALAVELSGMVQLMRGDALALALLERCLGGQDWIPPGVRDAAAEVLSEAGMEMWARRLRREGGGGAAFEQTLAQLVESGKPADLGDAATTAMLDALGLDGVMLRSASSGRVLWSCGHGAPAAEIARGDVVIVPLGRAPADDPRWRLVSGLLELFAPAEGPSDGADVEETGIYGSSPAMQELRADVRRFGPSQATILLLGETGVGKDLAARALHRLSGREGGFVPVNVGAIPNTLLEAELFGAVRGAYTGAEKTRKGLADAADSGTLFLDEIGDLGLDLQVKLLRFLEAKEVRPVGSDSAHTVDVRIVAATHRDLVERVENGTFRQDLYYRITALPIRIPPLRDRREDISLLRALVEEEIAAREGLPKPRWSAAAEAMLRAHSWPGNVRELRNIVEGALLRAGGGTVTADDLPFEIQTRAPTGTWEEATRRFRRELIEATLERTGGNKSAAARELGITRQALLYHVKQLGIAGR